MKKQTRTKRDINILEVVMNQFGSEKQKENYKNISDKDKEMLIICLDKSTLPVMVIIKSFFGHE